jgi:hypothetical protein
MSSKLQTAVTGSGTVEEFKKSAEGNVMAINVMAHHSWNVYNIMPDRLSFAIIRSHEEAVKCQAALPEKYLFTADFQELYRPLNRDFGPVNLGVIHSFCVFMRKMLACSQGQELVYYSVSPPPRFLALQYAKGCAKV